MVEQISISIEDDSNTPSQETVKVETESTQPVSVEVEDEEMKDDETKDKEKNSKVLKDKVGLVNGTSNEQEESDSSDEQQMSLPISKIKRIFKMDPDYIGSTKGAVYATGLATELFVQYFVEQASLLAKMDKRKKIQYKDFANAVSSHDSLNFLGDTVPRTSPVGELVKKKQINILEAEVVSASADNNIISATTNENNNNNNNNINKKNSNHDDPNNQGDGNAYQRTKANLRPEPILPKGQQILNFQPAKVEKLRKPPLLNDLVLQEEEKAEENQDVVMKE